MKLDIVKLKKYYNGRLVLDVNGLTVESGRIVALIGPNGSGKSTLLRLLAGMDKPEDGSILYDGYGMLPAESIAFQPQLPYIFDLTVSGNVELGLKDPASRREAAAEALKNVRMESFAGSRAQLLSGGEKQRVALARTLALDKRLVLLDEPASSIDILSIKLVEDYIRRVSSERRSTVVFATHNPSQAVRTADEVCFLWEGRLLEKGGAAEVVRNPQTAELKAFLEDWRL